MRKPRHVPKGRTVSAEAIQRAAACHQRGELAQADRLYSGILAADPNHFDALHLLGVLRQQQGRSAEALKLIASALRLNAGSSDALSNYGVVLDTLQRHEEAIAVFDRALALKPAKADALNNRGNALGKLGRHAEALANCEAALVISPNYVDALANRGNALSALGRHADALASYAQALAGRPGHLDALAGKAAALMELARHDEARATLDQVLRIDDKNVPAHTRRGNALFALERYPEALASYDAALTVDPRLPSALNNRGYALLALGQLDDALASYQAALARDPNYVEALLNCANALAALDRHDEADRYYDKALALAPDLAEARWSKSLLYLSCGRFAEGWELYEHRWTGGIKGAMPRTCAQPRWAGGHVEGTLLVWGEQGLGDQILHASMVPELAARAGSVRLEVEPRLVTLFKRSFPGVDVAALGPELPAGCVDVHAPLGALGQHLRPSWEAFPNREHGYLVADAERAANLRQRLTNDKRKLIGLSWRSVAPLIGRSKSAELHDFAPLLRLPDCRFVDLQYGDTLADRVSVERELGIRIERLDDIDNTNDIDGLAALIAACDAVVTVSNTTAHLAGALGRPTWVLIPFGNARIWYWFKDRPDSPWYSRVRLVRQRRAQPWADLIGSATQEISDSRSMT